MVGRAYCCHTYETLSLCAFTGIFKKIWNLCYDVIMTSSKFKSEIMREPWYIGLIDATHNKPYHFLHLIDHFQNFQIYLMTSL
jgi:hypothetical protein